MTNEITGAFIECVEHGTEFIAERPPSSLMRLLSFIAEQDGVSLPDDPLRAISDHLAGCGPNDRILLALTVPLHAWDHAVAPPWGGSTAQHTIERRNLILKVLGFRPDSWSAINAKLPRYTDTDVPVVIAAAHEEWYDVRRPHIRDFYWKHYRENLIKPKGSWDPEELGILGLSTDDVISRLSDPTRPEIYPVKGLVMGYVQSGKTSHFSGLIAKAADAGYRLVVVLAGTMDILRLQTQRRVDKEIVGRELLLDSEEYRNATDRSEFVVHGGRPSELGYFDWERLTTSEDDYTTLRKHLSVLEFRPADRTKLFNHPDNLINASAKLAIIKKVPARINKLCDDLERLVSLRTALMHVPTLIIDDESDQASVNTIDQRKPGNEGRQTATNKAIGRLLKLLPRAQYVGYTATPFANVFINPDDAEDLFPKDFIISLPKPKEYMGVSDFFDLDQEFPPGDFRGNHDAFVRPVEGHHEDPGNLPAAIDSFILAGAIKLFRQAKDPNAYQYQHHTMLVHQSATRLVQEQDRRIVEDIFAGGARYQRKAGMEALKTRFLEDFVPVSKIRAPEAPFPRDFQELLPYISECLSRICADKPVRVVNGDERNREDTPAFDQTSVWAILVGGAKLSRGYTVEGLTVSYYRRAAGAGDTLMQMGRWFGFRRGYRDLVRLYIGSKEPRGRVTIDLYEAFGAVCRDEESLRTELRKYSKSGLVPRQVPPLVTQHLPWLPPAAPNKMFNAEIRSRDFAGEYTEKTSAPAEAELIRGNQLLTSKLLNASSFDPPVRMTFIDARGSKQAFDALVGVASGEDILSFMRQYRWAEGLKSIYLETEYVQTMLKQDRLKHWHIMIPQRQTGRRVTLPGLRLDPLYIVERARASESRFSVYSEPRHREAAAYLSGNSDVGKPSPSLVQLRGASVPVLLMYLVEPPNAKKPEVTVGFGIQYCGQKKQNAITWTVKNKRREDAVLTTVVAR